MEELKTHMKKIREECEYRTQEREEKKRILREILAEWEKATNVLEDGDVTPHYIAEKTNEAGETYIFYIVEKSATIYRLFKPLWMQEQYCYAEKISIDEIPTPIMKKMIHSIMSM